MFSVLKINNSINVFSKTIPNDIVEDEEPGIVGQQVRNDAFNYCNILIDLGVYN